MMMKIFCMEQIKQKKTFVFFIVLYVVYKIRFWVDLKRTLLWLLEQRRERS